MKHNLKSDIDKLVSKGMALEEDINLLKDKPLKELINYLNDNNAIIRTSASVNLKYYIDRDEICNILLLQLFKEKSLYTKIAICETLQNGDINTASKMINYVGIIGKNQYKTLPKKISSKKSYPLPRDIIARTLAKMDITIFNLLLEILATDDLIKIYEIIDAIGYMAFHNESLQNKKNLKYIINLMNKYKDDKLLIWKCLTCLSAFNIEESKDILNKFLNEYNNEDILFLQAKMSLSILKS
ncbi:hypothetical protein [Brachyspira sp.]|uniref:hypothetical protein n=1 Tax=Brachyspira sp. TaxID=1977261 RepID=UPI0026041E69|nr:hypothetical protein [Brachyspira sp.]